MIEKRKPIRSKKILKAAEGDYCAICGMNDNTVVFAHLNESYAGKGIGQKADDIAGFFACSVCHDLYDGLSKDHDVSDWVVCRAMYRTWRRLWERGVIGELK